MSLDLHEALARVIETQGSDLHLKVPAYPLIRTHGHLRPIPDTQPLQPEDTDAMLRQMLADPKKLEELDETGEVDFSYAVEGLARFRVNAVRQRGHISIVCRAIRL